MLCRVAIDNKRFIDEFRAREYSSRVRKEVYKKIGSTKECFVWLFGVDCRMVSCHALYITYNVFLEEGLAHVNLHQFFFIIMQNVWRRLFSGG